MQSRWLIAGPNIDWSVRLGRNVKGTQSVSDDQVFVNRTIGRNHPPSVLGPSHPSHGLNHVDSTSSTVPTLVRRRCIGGSQAFPVPERSPTRHVRNVHLNFEGSGPVLHETIEHIPGFGDLEMSSPRFSANQAGN